MFMFPLLGSMAVGALVGFLAERFGLVSNGVITSALLGLAGGVVMFFFTALFGIGFGGRTMTSAIGAALALFVAPRLGRKG